MTFRKSDLFVQFRSFYIKEFTGQKKVTNKLFKSVRCVVIAKRVGGVRSARWDSVGCVSMWWFMYIGGYIFVFYILRKWGLSMFRFACFCLLGVSHFLHFFTSSPIYDFSYEKFLFFFFLILFLNKK